MTCRHQPFILNLKLNFIFTFQILESINLTIPFSLCELDKFCYRHMALRNASKREKKKKKKESVALSYFFFDSSNVYREEHRVWERLRAVTIPP